MKDVAACEKLRGAGKRALIRRYPNGETHPCLDGFRQSFVVAQRDDKSRTKLNDTVQLVKESHVSRGSPS